VNSYGKYLFYGSNRKDHSLKLMNYCTC